MAAQSTSLATIGPGKQARVVAVTAGRGLAQRLADMGLTRGTLLRVVNRQGSGPTLVELRGTRIVLGSGISQKIIVDKTGD
jgi:ferrous iron transport protein A